MECIYCSKICKNDNSLRNHTRLCKLNPTRQVSNFTLFNNSRECAWNKGLTKETSEGVAKNTAAREKHYADNPGKKRGQASFEVKSANAKKQGFGGYRANAGHSKKFKVLDSFGIEVTLQSTYELECSKVLNELSINWIRPRALMYDDRRYFADFYLPDFDIWLDPKNDYKIIQDKEKIEKVIEQNNIILLVLTKNMINKEYISSIVQRQNIPLITEKHRFDT